MLIPFIRFPYLVQRNIMSHLQAKELYMMTQTNRKMTKLTKCCPIGIRVCLLECNLLTIKSTIENDEGYEILPGNTLSAMVHMLNSLTGVFKVIPKFSSYAVGVEAATNIEESWEIVRHMRQLGILAAE